jgi:hypothetical protein
MRLMLMLLTAPLSPVDVACLQQLIVVKAAIARLATWVAIHAAIEGSTVCDVRINKVLQRTVSTASAHLIYEDTVHLSF